MSWIFLWLEAIRKNAAVQTNHRLDPWNSVDPWNPGCPIERLIGGFTGGRADQLTCSCSLDWSLPSLLYQISFYKLSVNNHILEIETLSHSGAYSGCTFKNYRRSQISTIPFSCSSTVNSTESSAFLSARSSKKFQSTTCFPLRWSLIRLTQPLALT